MTSESRKVTSERRKVTSESRKVTSKTGGSVAKFLGQTGFLRHGLLEMVFFALKVKFFGPQTGENDDENGQNQNRCPAQNAER